MVVVKLSFFGNMEKGIDLQLFDPEQQKLFIINVSQEQYWDIVVNDNLELAKTLLLQQQEKENFLFAHTINKNLNEIEDLDTDCGPSNVENAKEKTIADTEVTTKATSKGANNDAENIKMWTNEATKLLISLCKKYDKDFETGIKKYIWGKIAKEMTEKLNQNHVYTSQQCDTKFKGLKNTYKQVQKHNEQSGNNTKTWEFYSLMDEILFCKPEITAKVTCSSKAGLITQTKTNTPEKVQTENVLCETPALSSFSKKRKKAENAIEKRHQEKMCRQDRYLDLLERLTKAVEKSNKEN